jgi:hemerythrin-like metal-binding protein
MDVPAFDDALRTGNALIDEQHESLFRLAARVAAKIGPCEVRYSSTPDDSCNDRVEDALEDAVYGLADYVVEHFSDEIGMMHQAGYPGASPHEALHAQLSAHVTGYVTRYANGDAVAASELVTFFTAWLTDHIMQQDRAFADWLARQ